MKLLDLSIFHQTKPIKYTSNGAFNFKYRFIQDEEKSYPAKTKKKLNTLRAITNNLLMGLRPRYDDIDLHYAMAEADFFFNPFLVIIYKPIKGDAKANVWINGEAIQFKQMYTLSSLKALNHFKAKAQIQSLIIPYHLLEMLKNEAEWDMYQYYLNFTFSQLATEKQPSEYHFIYENLSHSLKGYQSSLKPFSYGNRKQITSFSIHGITAYQLYQAIITPQGEHA